MKKILWIITAITAVFLLSVSASAYETEYNIRLLYNGDLVGVHFDTERENNFTNNEKILYDILKTNMEIGVENIDISKAGYTNEDELNGFIEETLNIEIFWREITGDVKYTVYDLTDIVTHVRFEYIQPTYLASAEQSRKTVITSVQQGIEHALNSSLSEGMSDLEKVTALHDYLVRECDYYQGDLNALENGDNVFKAEGVFIDRAPVCQGYSVAYSQLLLQCGIESCIVGSDTMNHAWNMVKLEDKWYHVDVTWDDPIFTGSGVNQGYIRYDYFLKSDDEFNELEHHDWKVENSLHPEDKVYSPTPEADHSNSFEGYVFRNKEYNGNVLEAGFLNYLDGKYYYLRFRYSNTNTLCVSNFDGTEEQIITLPRSYFFMYLFNGKLYANRDNLIVELNKDGSEAGCVKAVKDGVISNIWVALDELMYKHVVDGTASVYSVDDLTYKSVTVDGMSFIKFSDNTASLISYSGTSDTIEIPEYANGYRVTEIGRSSFYGNQNIKKVVLPESIEKIGADAFLQNSKLTEIILNNGLKIIEDSAFWNCYTLEEVTIPSTVEEIGNEAFRYCYWLEKVTFIGDVPEILGQFAFGDVDSNFAVYYDIDNSTWKVTEGQDGVKFWTDAYGTSYKAIGIEINVKGDADGDNRVTEIDLDFLIDYFTGKSNTVPDAIWADIDGNGVVTRKDAMIAARHFEKWPSVAHYFE